MAEGYEWVFVISYVSIAFMVLTLCYEAYVMVGEHRSRSSTRAAPRAKGSPPRLKMRPRVRSYGRERRSPLGR